jgi:hypothetical protein
MRDIEDLGPAILLKIQHTNKYLQIAIIHHFEKILPICYEGLKKK